MKAKDGVLDANKHSHKLARANFLACSTCGRPIATTFKETKTGELLIEELEFDMKIVSSRTSRLRTTTAHPECTYSNGPSDVVITVENTCW